MSALNELMNYTFVSRYSRWQQDKRRRETWKEATDRVRNMMLEFYKDKDVEKDIDCAYDMMANKKILGSQRALQFGGKPILQKHARLYNCVSSPCDRPRFFQEYFWLLLCGCGAGFSVQKHHIKKLPRLFNTVQRYCDKPIKEFVIPDTIEGWADAIGILLTSYLNIAIDKQYKEYVDYRVRFKFHKIRKKGSPLSSGVGKAPGPEGLANSLKQIDALLLRCLQNKQAKLKPIDAYDICMHIADAVLSGGVRRSATIALFSPDDEDMLNAKTGNWFIDNPQRARSNNSCVLLKSDTSYPDFQDILQHTKEYGEPGFVWVDDLEHLVNPCVEISFWCYNIVDQTKYDKYMETYDGKGYDCNLKKIGLESGWQGCNLSTINSASVKSTEDFFERARAAAIIGTFQAGYTTFNYLTPASEAIFKREALLGVSMTGTMENFDIVLDPNNQKEAARIIKETNKEFAQKIGINQAARLTCLKPEGTTSCILGTSSGIHPHHSKRYHRVVQANKTETPYNHFRTINETACETSVWSNNNTDDVIRFPIEVPDGAKTKNQLPALALLEIVRSTQQNWVIAGTNKNLCTQPWLTHNVSNTINVLDDEWEDVGEFIYKNRRYFCGISLLPHSGDKDYPQAPFTAVYTSREIVKEYGEPALWTSGLIELALQSFENNLWTACDFCLIERQREDALSTVNGSKGAVYRKLGNKLEFFERMKKYAKKYFDNDLKRLTYCMKDVYNWKLYCDLRKTFKAVDYTTMIEDEDNTKLEEEIACAGGACEIV